MSLPEGLYLLVEGDHLSICDAQEIPHVTFQTGAGDPVDWSANIVQATCRALGVTEAWTGNGFETGVEGAIALWHIERGVEDGFLL